MSLPRVYSPQYLKIGLLINIDEAASRHLLTVLRLSIGDSLQIFNGEGGAYAARLQACQKKSAQIQIGEFLAIDRESPLKIHLGQAISRGERMDYTIQKSVELGVDKITPVFSERCGVQLKGERIENRVQHWQKIAISASEQSGRCHVPKIENPVSFDKFITEAKGWRFICNPENASSLNDLSAKISEATLLIGPEGGFSAQEIQQACQSEFYSLSLGPRILRTETAAVVALTLLQNQWGDLS